MKFDFETFIYTAVIALSLFLLFLASLCIQFSATKLVYGGF